MIGTAVTLCTPLSMPAIAQETTLAVDVLEEISVTATRTNRTDYSAPTPTSIVSEETLDTLQISNVAQLMSQIPALKATSNPANNGVRTQVPGATLADLRGLGAQRTLVLTNGVRLTPQAPSNNVGATVSPDMNQIPAMMVDRLEIVTGGASAQWGSDAVAGVVNIILRTDFTGFEAKVQGGASTHGDAAQYRLGTIAGTEFADGRGHVVAAVDYANSDGLQDIYSRDWGRQEYQLVANPSAFNAVTGTYANGLPANIIAPGVHASSAPGGLITGPAGFSLRNSQFLPGGATTPFSFGTVVSGNVMIGGEGESLSKGIWLAPSVERATPFVYATWELSGNTKLFAEAGYSWVKGHTVVLPPRDGALTIQRDNPFLPAAVVAAMTGENIASFTMSRVSYDLGGNAPVTIENETPHAAFGVSGALFDGAWRWDAHVNWGRNEYTNTVENNRIAANFTSAVNAVASGGTIVCRAPVAGSTPGCVPINLFGQGAPSQAAIDYVTGTSHSRSVYEMYGAAANLSGEPFDSWAGPVSLATGIEYRRESQTVTADPVATANATSLAQQSAYYEVANVVGFSGDFSVTEGYVETVVPMLRNLPGVKALDFNAAARLADYSTAGNQTTWKAGLSYEPLLGLRFRGTRSRDIRAPALYELYSRGSASNQAVSVQPPGATGVINSIGNIPQNTTVGNPDLNPEKADTTTVGIVFEPVALPGFGSSLDYYDIDLKQAITSLTGTTVAQLCSAGQQRYCDAFTFTYTGGVPTGVTALNLGVQNAASNRVKGYDLSVSYTTPTFAWGSLSFSLNESYVTHFIVDAGTGAAPVERAGDITVLPKHRATLLTSYGYGDTSLSAQVTYVSSANLNNTFDASPRTTVTNNRIPSYTYLNLFASHNLLDEHLQVFGSLSNVFDKDPPVVPNTLTFQATNGAFYDVIGRAYQVGMSYRF